MSNPFEVLEKSDLPILEVQPNSLPASVDERITELTKNRAVVLFMKGNASMPQCGFSANSVAILAQTGVPFQTYNILNDPELRQKLKEVSSWPTYPQLYVKGEMVGGNDILTEMHQKGEISQLFENLDQ